MTYKEWMMTVPQDIKGDALWCMEVYRLGLFAEDLAWPDATKLVQDKCTISLSDQLYRAVGSVSSIIAEGYSRQSGKDPARFYEDALGSAREARNWYWPARHVWTDRVALHRIALLTHIIRSLLKVIPSERGYALHEDSPEYAATLTLDELLQTIPT